MSPFLCFNASDDHVSTLPRSNSHHRRLIRRSTLGPLRKNMISEPSNFVHCGHVGGGKPGVAIRQDLSELFNSINKALNSPKPLSNSATPISTRALPPAFTQAALTPLSSEKKERRQSRKPPPAVTPSVIKQAGMTAVEKSARPAFVSPPLPKEFVGEALEEMKPFKQENCQESGTKRHETLAGRQEAEDTMVRSIQDDRTAVETVPPTLPSKDNVPYATETGELRWEGAMAEVEAALSGPSP